LGSSSTTSTRWVVCLSVIAHPASAPRLGEA
jgi:hypothetical protein